MAATIAEIAKAAGCSPATVSRALNGTANVHDQTAARIRKAAALLAAPDDGRPARGRPRGSVRKPDAVDLIVFRRERIEPLSLEEDGLHVASSAVLRPETFFAPHNRLTTDFYRHILEGAVSRLGEHGLKAVQQVRRDLTETRFLSEINTRRCRGVLLLGEPGAEAVGFARQCTRPLVLVDILGVEQRPVVSIDNSGGMASAMRHLLGLGHRAIGFVGPADNPSFRERRLSYFGQMADAGLAVRPDWIHDAEPGHNIESVARAMPQFLARPQRPSAIVCCSDCAALGVLRGAQAMGLRVPHDLSVVGFDDIDAAALVTPALTTLRVPTAHLGVCAVDLLLQSESPTPSGPWHGSIVRCRTELIVRGSTAAPGSGSRARNPRKQRRRA